MDPSDDRQVLHFRPIRYARFSQALELTIGDLIQGQAPLFMRRKEIIRPEAIQFRARKRKDGWQLCPPQRTPPPEVKPPVRRSAASMGTTGLPPCC